MPKPKDIIEEKEFTKKREAIFPDAELFDDVSREITYIMAKKPEIFPLVEGTKIRIAVIQQNWATNRLKIFFLETQKAIVLLDLVEEE